MTNAFSTVRNTLLTVTLLTILLPLTACEELAAPDLTSGTTHATFDASASSDARASSLAPHETVRLDLGATVTLRGGHSLSFDAMGPDGRCPIGVECLVPGEVEADFTIDMGHGPIQASLTLPGGDPKALPLHLAPWVSVDGFIVYLVELSPYPVAGDVEDTGDGAERSPTPLDMGPPTATLVVRSCPNTNPNTEGRCAGGTSSDYTPVLTTIRSGNGGLANLTFRTAEGVSIDDAPLFVSIGGETHEMPLEAGPARFAESDGTLVDQATYAMSHATLGALDHAVHAEVLVSVAMGGEYVSFPYVSGDLVESDERPEGDAHTD